MLNVIIEINHEDQTFDIKWILNRDAILEVGKNYCPCCYYRLNSKKSKVEKIMDILFAEEAVKIPPHEKSIKDGIAECYSLFLKNELDFNIVVSKEFINDSIPIKGITLKEKHIIVEELSDEVLEEKNKELLKEIIEDFNGISKDNAVVYQTVGSNDVGNEEFSLENFRKMFEIMTSKVKLTTEMLKKIMDHCRKVVGDTEEIGNKFTHEFASKGIISEVSKDISKPIKDVETNYWSKINQIGTTLERVKKIATYDLSVNNEPTFSLKIGKDIFLFNSIEAYFRDGFGKFHNYYLYIDQNGMMQSNISIKEFELFLLSNSFYNIIDFDQQRYLINTNPSMPGTIRFNSDIILLRECKDFHRDFPRVEKLGFVKGIEKFDRLISPNYYRELIVKKGVEKRYSSLLGENKEQNNNDASFIQNICYVDFVKNHLFTFSSNKIEGQELYRISLANDMNLLIDTENYLFNHIGSGKDPSTIFVLTKTACDALKTQIQFQDRGEIKFEICDEICEFIGVGNISPKVNVSQKTFDNNNLSIASENGNPIVYFDVYEDDVKKVLKAFNELSNEAEKLYTLDGSISKDNLAVIHKLNAVVNKEIPNVQYFITEKGKKFLEDTNHHVKLNFDLVRDYTTDNINVNDKEFLYLSVYQNKLKVSLGTNLNQQSKKILYKISDKNDTLSIKNLSSWISAMYQGEDKKYSYKDILITALALKKLRQEEVFDEMNFEEVEEVK